TPPDLTAATLVIAGQDVAFEILSRQAKSLELRVGHDATDLLRRPVPVAIRWRDGDEPALSNPVFVCNVTALTAALETGPEDEKLRRVGRLDLEDEELENLLEKLDAALVIDRRSVWRLAGKSVA